MTEGMYLAHYNLSSRPFDISPTPSGLLDTPTHREALAALIYGLTHGQAFVVLTGEIGTGKTTLLMAARNSVQLGHLQVVSLLDPGLQRTEFIESLAFELGCAPGGPSLSLIRDALIQIAAQGRRVVLVVDEAQNLSEDVFNLLRYLTNLQGDEGSLLQVVLVGQPELLEILKQDELRALRQRVTHFAELSPLTKRESVRYIEHRLRVAGGNPGEVMTRGAMALLARAGNGLPRRLNVLCDHALLAGYSRGVPSVDREIARAAVNTADGVRTDRRRPVLAALALLAVILIAVGAAWRTTPNWCEEAQGYELALCDAVAWVTSKF